VARIGGGDHDRPMPSVNRIISIVAVAALSVLAVTAVVEAQSPGEQLEACAGARGELRLVAAQEACTAGERRVSWNVAGPAGPAGAQGAPGATGAKGPRGRPGKVQLKLGGSAQTVLALKLLNKRVKKLGEQLSAVNTKLTALDGKVVKDAALGRRAYERIYHVCLGVESAKAFNSTPAETGIVRCKYGFYTPFPGYDSEP
jgi:hypothetical protein